MAQAAGDEIMVTIDRHLRAEGVPEEFLFNIHDLVKRYDIGDSVVVSRGKEFGNSGIVVAIGDYFRAKSHLCPMCHSNHADVPHRFRHAHPDHHARCTPPLTYQQIFRIVLIRSTGTRSFKSRMEDCCNPAG